MLIKFLFDTIGRLACSSVRRILKRGGGQKLQKFRFRPIFRPISGEEQKKKCSLKFRPVFRPNSLKFPAKSLKA